MTRVFFAALVGLTCGLVHAAAPSPEKNSGQFSAHCAQAVKQHAQNVTGHDTFAILRVVPVVASAKQFACAVRGQRIASGQIHQTESRLWLFAMKLDEKGRADVDPSSSWSEIPVRP